MRLHSREHGRGAPLILLHGLFGSLDNWAPISRGLSAHFHVFSVDQRNHGASPHSAEMSYPLMAGDLADFLRDHSIERAHVLGHSMGGKTAMQFALLHPAQVERLIVADMAPRAGEPEHESLLAALAALDLKCFHSRQQVEAALAPRVPDLAVRRFLTKSLARDANGAFHWRFNLAGLSRNYARLNAAVTADRPFVRPTLFVRGANSRYLRESDLPAIRRQFPRAAMNVIPEAGHWVHADAPGIFLERVLHFLGGDL